MASSKLSFLIFSRLQYACSAFPRSSEWKSFIFWTSVRWGYILILIPNRSSESSNFSDLPSKTESEAVRAFGIGSRLADGNVCVWGANKIFVVEGRSFDCSLCMRFGLFVGWFVESLRTPVTTLRLFTGVVLELVAV